MNPMNRQAELWSRMHRRRMAIAVLAAVLSIGAHVGLLLVVSDLPAPFRYLRNPLPPPPPREPIRLLDIQPTPLRPKDHAAREAERRAFVKKFLETPAPTDLETPLPEPPPADLAPPASPAGEQALEAPRPVEPEPPPREPAWSPRQEILSIDREVVPDELAARPRRVIPKIQRVPDAPDIALPVAREDAEIALAKAVTDGVSSDGETGAPPGTGPGTPPPSVAVDDLTKDRTRLAIGEKAASDGGDLFREKPAEISRFKPLENLLTAGLYIYRDPHRPDGGYFRLEIRRRNRRVLPALPKDILFAQDCSASISEQRLYFCRKGLADSLALLGPADRFNILKFKDKAEFLFPDWAPNTPENRQKARAFIAAMRAGGDTDILEAVSRLKSLKLTPGRPAITILITDGRPTTGVTAASAIIREFSRMNNGAISVFTVGTSPFANRYLLDMLSYCNRGTSRFPEAGRWSLPETIRSLVQEVSRPVMADVRFRFPEDSSLEVYPRQTMNLYSDRPLVLYGRFDRSADHVIFQATGLSLDRKSDMIFDLPLGQATPTRDKSIPTEWARQKIYYLLGVYARNPRPDILNEIRQTAREYRIPIPHRGEF